MPRFSWIRDHLAIASVAISTIGTAAVFLAALFFTVFLTGVLFIAASALRAFGATFLTEPLFWDAAVVFAAWCALAVSDLVADDACRLTACFARATASAASFSTFRRWGALAEYRSMTIDINDSILVSRLRALFAFMALAPSAYQTTRDSVS